MTAWRRFENGPARGNDAHGTAHVSAQARRIHGHRTGPADTDALKREEKQEKCSRGIEVCDRVEREPPASCRSVSEG